MADTSPIMQILTRWPTRRDVFEDARAADPDLDMIAVHRWFQRESVPPKYDAALLQGAERRGIGLHYMELVKARAAHADQAGHGRNPAQVGRRKPCPNSQAGAA